MNVVAGICAIELSVISLFFSLVVPSELSTTESPLPPFFFFPRNRPSSEKTVLTGTNVDPALSLLWCSFAAPPPFHDNMTSR